jgi:co-chaperonin GroES (HSP10)
MLKPVNRHILIEIEKSSETPKESIIVLPEDYKPEEERYISANVVNYAEDVRFSLSPHDKIIVDRTMIEEISINESTFNVVLDNYVIGIIQ